MQSSIKLPCDQQIHGIDPFVQRDMTALENRAGADGEVFLALVTAIIAAFPRRDPVAQAARRTGRAIGPQPRFEVSPGGFLRREHLEELES